ncbi:MAG: hypothetical protein AAFN94_00855 [Pseudomonadota bacterium]
MTRIITFSEFFGKIAKLSAVIELDSNTSGDETGSGEAARATYGTQLFRGTVTLQASDLASADSFSAKLALLKSADCVFEFTPLQAIDRQTIIDAIEGIGDDRRDIYLQDTANVLGAIGAQEGAYFSVSYASGKRSLHQVALDRGTVSAPPFSGRHLVAVPPAPFSVLAGDTVVLGNPVVRAILDTATPHTFTTNLGSGATFNWVQTF